MQRIRLEPGGRKFAAVCALFTVLFPFLGHLMWRPDWVVWTVNGKAMSDAGVWVGMEAFFANISHFFISFYGRTSGTTLLMVLWISAFILMVKKITIRKR